MLPSPGIGPPHFLGTVGGFPLWQLHVVFPSSGELLVAGWLPSWVEWAILAASIAGSPVPLHAVRTIAVHAYWAHRAGLAHALFVLVPGFGSSFSVPLPYFLALRLACLCDRSVSGRASCVVALWVRVPSWDIVLRHWCLLPSWLATAPVPTC